MKVIALVCGLILLGNFAANQEAFADLNSPTKSEKQTVAAMFVIAFVFVFGFLIFIRKSNDSNNVSYFDKSINK